MQINLYEDADENSVKRWKYLIKIKKSQIFDFDFIWMHADGLFFLTDKKCMTKCNDHIDADEKKMEYNFKVW